MEEGEEGVTIISPTHGEKNEKGRPRATRLIEQMKERWRTAGEIEDTREEESGIGMKKGKVTEKEGRKEWGGIEGKSRNRERRDEKRRRGW